MMTRSHCAAILTIAIALASTPAQAKLKIKIKVNPGVIHWVCHTAATVAIVSGAATPVAAAAEAGGAHVICNKI
jgi:hypothetical protein